MTLPQFMLQKLRLYLNLCYKNYDSTSIYVTKTMTLPQFMLQKL